MCGASQVVGWITGNDGITRLSPPDPTQIAPNFQARACPRRIHLKRAPNAAAPGAVHAPRAWRSKRGRHGGDARDQVREADGTARASSGRLRHRLDNGGVLVLVCLCLHSSSLLRALAPLLCYASPNVTGGFRRRWRVVSCCAPLCQSDRHIPLLLVFPRLQAEVACARFE